MFNSISDGEKEKLRKIFSGIASILLLIGMLTFPLELQIAVAETIIVPDNSPTIQAAINHAFDGDTVFVRTGTYHEDIVVNKSISLVGDNTGTTIILGGNETSVVSITSNDATLANFTIENNEKTEDRLGITLNNVTGCNISGNNLTASNLIGIDLISSSYNQIAGNMFFGNGLGITAGSFENTVAGNRVNDKPLIYLEGEIGKTVEAVDAGQVILVNCSNAAIENGQFSNTSIGVQIRESNHCNVTQSAFTNSFEGISLSKCSNILISGNNMTNNTYGLVFARNVNNSVVSDNYVANSTLYGIYLGQLSTNNNVTENTLMENNINSVYLDYSSNNTISGNNIINGMYGIVLWVSSSNILTQNNVTSVRAPDYGIYLTESSNNVISENNVTALDGDGITFDHSSSCNLCGNNMVYYGIGISFLQFSSNNTIRGNDLRSLTLNGLGLYFGTLSDYNCILENDIRENTHAFEFWNCSNNHIYHNNIINNTYQALNDFNTSTSIWDNGYPSGGNYWSDYNGTDISRGACQNETGSDGIGDTPNVIDPQNTDNYPLMGPFGPSTEAGENVTVFPASDVGLIFDSVTVTGSTSVNETEAGPAPPSGFKLEGRYYDVTTTASFLGKIQIRIIYDDSNMTPEEENSLYVAYWNSTLMQWVNITTCIDVQNNVIYGETSHLSGHGVFSVEIHDVAITNAVLSKTVVGRNFNVSISVAVANHGDFQEVFNVTVYANSSIITRFEKVTVPAGGTTTLTVVWNTTGFSYSNYTISAVADTVPDETDTADNLIGDRWIVVTIPGDINGDLMVKPYDLARLIAAFGSDPYPPNPRPWNPNADINGDDKVGPYDLAVLIAHYGQHYP